MDMKVLDGNMFNALKGSVHPLGDGGCASLYFRAHSSIPNFMHCVCRYWICFVSNLMYNIAT